MNKKIGILTSLFLVTYVVSIEVLAKTDNKAIDLNKINNSNHFLLFKSEPNVVVLNKEEMRQTEGKFVQIAVPLFFGWGLGTANAPTLGGSSGGGSDCSSCHSREIIN